MTQLPDGISGFAGALADAAGAEIVPRFRTAIDIESKADESPVTIADREAEAAMRRLINERYPGHGIIGEEYGSENAEAEFVWVLDPVDGTRAFIAGKPIFGTLIALLQGGRPVLGVIDQPVLRERWIGIAGEQTTLNGAPVTTRDCPVLSDALLNSTSPDMFDAEALSRFQALSAECGSTQYGGDCYGYALLAGGHIDLVVETDLKPYDFCALIPVVEGAGGRMCDWRGEALSLDSAGDVIAAGDPALADAAADILSADY